jgi:hypothetical protein
MIELSYALELLKESLTQTNSEKEIIDRGVVIIIVLNGRLKSNVFKP